MAAWYKNDQAVEGSPFVADGPSMSVGRLYVIGDSLVDFVKERQVRAAAALGIAGGEKVWAELAEGPSARAHTANVLPMDDEDADGEGVVGIAAHTPFCVCYCRFDSNVGQCSPSCCATREASIKIVTN